MSNVEDKKLELTKIIIEKGGNNEIAESLINNNPAILDINDDFKRHIFLVMNNDIVYAVLFIIEDDLFWTVLNKDKCGVLIKSDVGSFDYVVLLMLESITKYNHLSYDKDDYTLEDAINKYSLVKKNEKSYHIK